MKTKNLLSILGLLLAGSFALQAQSLEKAPGTQRFEISPFYGYRFGGDVHSPLTGRTYGFEDAGAYGLFLDLTPQPNWPAKFELLWSRQDSSVNLSGLSGLGKVDVSIDEIQLGGVLERGGQHLREYVSLLAGATYYSTESYGSDTRFSLSLGAGVKYFFTRNLALRADLRGFCTIVDGSGGFIYNGGATVIAFSGSAVWQGQATVGLSLAF
jgi:opacity protein-like surface antigen